MTPDRIAADHELLKLERALERARQRLEYYELLADQTQHLLNTRIAELEQARIELQESETRFRQLADASFEAIFVLDGGRIVDANLVAVRLYGHARDHLLGLRLVDLIDDAAREQVAEHLAGPGEAPVEATHRRADGTTFQAELRSRPIPGRSALARVIAVRDVSQRKALERELERLARTDAVTEVNNRRWFMELARHELQRSQRYYTPMCLLILDIDHFKRINDRWGHQAGDRILRAMAMTCVSTLRQTDIFGRIGGEEFAAVLPMTSLDGGMVIAEGLRATLTEACVVVDSQRLTFTVSIGVTDWREGDRGLEALLGRADEMLYAAKHDGRNRVAAV